MIMLNRFVQAVRVGILDTATFVHVDHVQPVTAPMTTDARVMNYVKQNNGRRLLTVAQRRQIRRMQKRHVCV